MRLHILKLNPACIHTLVRTRARPLQGQRDARVSLNGHPSHLHVPEKHHSVRSPIFDGVGKDIDVHEGAPGLTGSELAKFSIGMPQPERGLSCVFARSEEFKLEDRLQRPETRWDFRSSSESRLPDTEVGITVGTELVCFGRKLYGSHDVEPVRVDLLEVVTCVHHGETVELQLGFRLRL